jgi:hypothetical protein
MIAKKSCTAPWNAAELKILKKLDSPYKIQTYLDNIDYNSVSETRSPRYIMKNRRAHCTEGALFAAACLEYIGYPPLVLDLKAENDDDHVIAIYKLSGCWGAVAKSNFTTIRYREPVYRSLRELAMSFFDFYFNTLGEKTLRAYSLPHNLNRFNDICWKTTEESLDDIGNWLTGVKHIQLIHSSQVKNLDFVGDYLLKSSLIGSNPAGLFIPKSKNQKPDRKRKLG